MERGAFGVAGSSQTGRHDQAGRHHQRPGLADGGGFGGRHGEARESLMQTERWHRVAVTCMALLQASMVFSEGAATVLTIETYTQRAVQEGVKGKQTDWVLEQA